MANFPTYPATTLDQGVDLVIFSSNQLHDVINGTAVETVETETGEIPTLRKALVDNFFFKSPILWANGASETVFNQLRYFENGILSGYYYAPSATLINPVPMGATPVGDNNWTLYALKTEQLATEVFPWAYDTATGNEITVSPPYIFDSAIVTINGVVQIQGEAFRIESSKIILAEPLGHDPSTGLPNRLFCFIGKITASTAYVEKELLTSTAGAAVVGLPTGGNVLQAMYYITPEQFGAVGDGVTNDTAAVLRTISYANANNIQIRADRAYRINGDIALLGIRWYGGKIIGEGATRVAITSSWFENVTFDRCFVQNLGGNSRFYRNVFSNANTASAFLVSDMTIPGTLDFSFNEIYGCISAITQNGAVGASMDYARYANNYIHDIRGDAIHLGSIQAHYENGLAIQDNTIADVNSALPGVGYGIRVTGNTNYNLAATDAQFAKKFTVFGNKISNTRHCILIEAGKNFKLQSNEVYPSNSVSASSGLTPAGITVLGSRDFEVESVGGNYPEGQTGTMVELGWGLNGTTAVLPPINFTMKNLDVPEGDVIVATSCADDWDNSVRLSSTNCNKLQWRGLASSSIFNNVRACKLDFIGRYAANEGVGGGVFTRTHYTYMNWNGCVVLDGHTTDVSFSKMFVDRCDQTGNNFVVIVDVDTNTHRGPVLLAVTEQYILDSDNFPGGRTFSAGSILWKRGGGKFVVTRTGAYIDSSGSDADQIKVTVQGQTYIQSNLLNWNQGSGAKAAGTEIVIPGAGVNAGDLTTVIIRGPYVRDGYFTVDIADPIVTGTNQGNIIRALYPVEYLEIA